MRTHSDVTEDLAFELLSAAWQLVDFATRQLNVLRTVPRLPRKDDRFRNFEKVGGLLVKVRNYIQHVDSETHKLSIPDAYPILGALAWADPIQSESYTVWLGSLPPGTSFHTVGFDRETQRYMDQVLLGVGPLTLNLRDVVEACAQADFLLAEYLSSNDLLAVRDQVPGCMHVGPLPDPGDAATHRYLRVKMIIN